MADLLTYLQTIQPISAELAAAIRAGSRRECFPARHLLLRPGQVARQIHFIEQGLVHGFGIYRDRKASSWFMREGDFVISVLSFITQTPSAEYRLNALETGNMPS